MTLTLEFAQALIAQAHGHARERGLRIAVAVVDQGGLLQALGRMDGAFPLSAQIAEAKAAGAALWQRDGHELAALQAERGAFFGAVATLTRLPIMPAAGSVVIRRDDQVLGAVGVSGASSDDDRECAEHALAQVLGREAG